MQAEVVLRSKGVRALINSLGAVEAERFITLINREAFDYTEWQRDLFEGMSVRELSQAAMQEYGAEAAAKPYG